MEIEIEVQERGRPKKTGQKKEKTEVKSKDIRDMFRNSHHDSRKETAEKRDTIIVIDWLITIKKKTSLLKEFDFFFYNDLFVTAMENC